MKHEVDRMLQEIRTQKDYAFYKAALDDALSKVQCEVNNLRAENEQLKRSLPYNSDRDVNKASEALGLVYRKLVGTTEIGVVEVNQANRALVSAYAEANQLNDDLTAVCRERETMITDLTAETLAELERLETEATPEPWVWTLTSQESREDVLAYFAEHYDKGEGGPLHGCGVPAPGCSIEDECLATSITGNGPTSKANARFSAAIRNHAPALIRAARKLEQIKRNTPKLGDPIAAKILENALVRPDVARALEEARAPTLRIDLQTVMDELSDARGILNQMVFQHCEEDENGNIESGYITANALALKYLASVGWYKITHEHGRQVIVEQKDRP